MAESKYFPNLENGVDVADVEQVEQAFSDIEADVNNILNTKQDKLAFDETPIAGSENPVTSGGVKTELDKKANADDVYKKTETYTQAEVKQEIKNSLATVYKFKGSVNNFDFLSEDDVAYNVSSVVGNVYNYVGEKTSFEMPRGSNDAYYYIPIYEATSTYFVVSLDTSMLFKVGGDIFVSDDGQTGTITITGVIYITQNSERMAKITYISDGVVVTTGADLGFSAAVVLEYGDNVAIIDLNGKPYLDKLAATVDLSNYQTKLTFDSAPTEESVNPVTSGGVFNSLTEKADKIKSIPHTSVSGYPAELTNPLAGEDLIACRVYGAEGGVGDLVTDTEHYGEYKITLENRGINLFDIQGLTTFYTGHLTIDGNKLILGCEESNTLPLKYKGEYIYPSLFLSMTGLKPGDTITTSKRRFIDGVENYEKGDSASNYPTMIPGRLVFIHKQGASVGQFILCEGYLKKNTITIPEDFNDDTYNYMLLYSSNVGKTVQCTLSELQIEKNSSASEYEPYTEPVQQTVYLPAPLTEGQLTGITGLKAVDSAVNTISALTATAPAKIEVEYYQDINKVLKDLKNAILANGGNI